MREPAQLSEGAFDVGEISLRHEATTKGLLSCMAQQLR
ncbi:MAG: hypothetical protein JWN04_3239 [Myxococcaceae bacterium]|nr:hypothetical protein [Myxococcaceae bacterium]